MKLFVINDTEWIAANTKEDAIQYQSLEADEIKSVEEIPETEWKQEIEYFNEDIVDGPIISNIKISDLIQKAIELGLPKKILTENL